MQEGVSNDIAFTAAADDAVHKALRDNMVLLEPVMYVEVTVPEEYLGPITADLNARRAEITRDAGARQTAGHRGAGAACARCSTIRTRCAA